MDESFSLTVSLNCVEIDCIIVVILGKVRFKLFTII